MLTCGYGFLRTGRTHGTDLRIRNARMTIKGNRATLSLHRAHGEAPVATGPGDQGAAAGRGRLRASRADREQVIDTLKAAFVQGRLAKDEFDARVGHALASRTYADLAALTADIPTGLTGAQPPRKPARAQSRPPVSTPVKSGVCVLIPPTTMLPAPYSPPAALPFLTVLLFLPSF